MRSPACLPHLSPLFLLAGLALGSSSCGPRTAPPPAPTAPAATPAPVKAESSAPASPAPVAPIQAAPATTPAQAPAKVTPPATPAPATAAAAPSAPAPVPAAKPAPPAPESKPAAPAQAASPVSDPGGDIAVKPTKAGLSKVGVAACKMCHKIQFASWSETAHAKRNPPLDCEACHGPGSEYKPIPVMKDPAKAQAAGLVQPSAAFCATCHKRGWNDGMLKKAHAHKP